MGYTSTYAQSEMSKQTSGLIKKTYVGEKSNLSKQKKRKKKGKKGSSSLIKIDKFG